MFFDNENLLLEVFDHLFNAFSAGNLFGIHGLSVAYKQRCQVFLNVALTCKGFLDPALDRLWARMSAIIPVLKLFPGFIFNESEGKYVLNGTVANEDWARFDYYAQRIRTFQINERDVKDKIDPSVFLYLHELRHTFFPRLRQFYYMSHDSSRAIPVSLFRSPSLESFIWDFAGIDGSPRNMQYERHMPIDMLIRAFLNALIQYERLQEIGLLGEHIYKESVNLIPRFASTLHTLSLSRMAMAENRSFITQICQMPSLQDLIIDISSLTINRDLKVGLDSLRRLEVRGTIISIQRLLTTIQSLHLRDLDMIFTGGQDVHELLSYTTARWSASLRVLSMRSQYEDDQDAHLTMEALKPIFSLPLTSFTLHSFDICFTDTMVEMFALAWPNLSRLWLMSFVDEICVTIASLHKLVQFCRNLVVLQLPFVETIVPVPDSPLQFNHPLQHFTFSTSSVGITPEAVCLVDHLLYLFPHLEELEEYAYNNVRGKLLLGLMRLVEQTRLDTLARCQHILEGEKLRGTVSHLPV